MPTHLNRKMRVDNPKPLAAYHRQRRQSAKET